MIGGGGFTSDGVWLGDKCIHPSSALHCLPDHERATYEQTDEDLKQLRSLKDRSGEVLIPGFSARQLSDMKE